MVKLQQVEHSCVAISVWSAAMTTQHL